ncbi:MAG: AAA family ATPase [Candidatus Eisenbacteria bacterium]|uniref:AAA family ATPase n=1 Tax=Eiseniibacteriota bacterium TaxID=2212470 RepID=A0A933SCJ5_UNCEI|nr:AAA family ATPase [Candidatus Eisenbacteria bacterium]
MYERHFGLRENPFPAGHQLRFLYPSREHQEARAHLRYGIENREPFVLITGEVGTGKTTALYDALAEWGSQVTVALITNSALSRQELLEEICLRFGLTPAPGLSKPQMLAALERHLSAVRNRGEHAVLLLDESQNLPVELLEEIRLLSNTEIQGEKLLQIFLVGQPELEAKLARPELRQLRQRITVHYRLNPLSPEETTGYIHHRLAVAGGNAISTFPPDACRAVYRVTHGIPREINTVAAQALLTAYADGAKSVRPEHVSSVASETEFRSVLGAPAEAIDPAPVVLPPPPAAAAPVAPVAPVTPAPPPPPAESEPVAPAVIEERTPVPTWTPPELASEPVAAFTPPVLPLLPEEPVAQDPARPDLQPLPHVEDESDLDVVEKQELDAWTRAAQELLEAKRRSDAADAAPESPAEAPDASAPRFPTAGELAAMGSTADPTRSDLSGLPARLREKIEDDIAAEERQGTVMPWLLGVAAVAAIVVAVVLLQRFQVIDVPFLRPLAGVSAPADSLQARTNESAQAAVTADSVAVADSVAAVADTNAVVVPHDSTIATKTKPFPVTPAPAAAPVAATPAPAAAPTSVFGIGVAAFLDRDRAEAERTRLAGSTGLEANIYPFRDGTTTMYRLVVGRFTSNAAAERKANELMQKDLVREARVMVVGGGAR